MSTLLISFMIMRTLLRNVLFLAVLSLAVEFIFVKTYKNYFKGLWGALSVDIPREESNSSSSDHSFRSFMLNTKHNINDSGVTSEVVTKHRDRMDNINQWCRERYTYLFKNLSYKYISTLYYYSRKYNFNYCKVDKAGGTFWLQLFFVLETEDETQWLKFLNEPRFKIHPAGNKYTVPFNGDSRTKSRTVLTSRDPYSRLFAVYIDKIYLPVQWTVAQTINNSLSAKTNKYTCSGKDVTFLDYLYDVIDRVRNGAVLDRHVTPITALCKPCDTDYFIHVKQESFADDIEYTLRALNISENKVRILLDALHEHRAEYTLPGIIDSVMLKGRAAQKCLTLRDIGARLWHSFQIQGYIDESLKFPKMYGQRSSTAAAELKDLVLRTIKASPLSSKQSKTQRRGALVNAYKTVDKDTIQAIQEIYYSDFKLFGYSLEPPR